jgi:hypothetical protein
MQTKIFLSYSSKDREQVRKLARDLRAHDIAVWLDEWEIRVGDSITQKIQMGLDDSQFIGVWLTSESVRSGWVEREWQSKFQQEVATGRVAVLPLLAGPCAIPRLLSDKRYADFKGGYEAGLRDLLKALVPTVDEAQVESVLMQAKDEFELGDDSYFNLSRGLLQLFRGNGAAGLLAAQSIVKSFQKEVRHAIIQRVSAERQRPSLYLPHTVIPEDNFALSSYHDISTAFGGKLLREINPFHLPCSYHPLIQLAAAVLFIQERCANVTLSPAEWNETLESLFSCLDFWIAFLSEKGGASPPEEQFVRDLMVTCASLWRSLGRRSHPAFFAAIISKQMSLSTYTPITEIMGSRLTERGMVKTIRSSREKSSAVPLSNLAINLFSLPEDVSNDGVSPRVFVHVTRQARSRTKVVRTKQKKE